MTMSYLKPSLRLARLEAIRNDTHTSVARGTALQGTASVHGKIMELQSHDMHLSMAHAEVRDQLQDRGIWLPHHCLTSLVFLSGVPACRVVLKSVG